MVRSPLLRTIATLTVLLALLTNIGTYGFYLALQATYAGNEDGEDAWLRVCAIFDIGAAKKTALSEVVLSVLESPDPLLRETALAACRNLLPPEQLSEMVNAHARADPSPTVRAYARTLLEAS